MRLFGVEDHDSVDGVALRSHECPVCMTLETDAVPVPSREGSASASTLPHARGFDDESLALLGTAFDAAWKVIQDSGTPLAEEPERAATRKLLAHYILVLGRRRERDPQRLIEEALGLLTNPARRATFLRPH